ncbi:peptidyl-prolyl cis-trans isomerase C [Mariprofundus ferrinatatus]|uniref:peptidylprolyl isomerase n=1 Tax=Mariprofundus ferrinatatus TaxID=1921087 RepID=A0A2K8L5I0_9PROT|nr:peptidylprolyl isomerase [Mariprofundus ferrinatatus]ATX81111.1 peptidyl-prolyl cis-trans isomerase C [Mariprofundus ferrinatatus]
MRWLIVIGFTLLLAGCQQQDEASLAGVVNPSPVVATVNGTPIHESDIDLEMAMLPEEVSRYRKDPKARAHILRTLIRHHAVSQKAEAIGLDLDPATRQHIESARRQILIEAAMRWQMANMKKIEEADAAAYYKQHPSEFSVPEQIHARHILVATEKRAWAVIKKLRKGADFSALAASESLDDSNKSRGGDLNWFQRGVMVKPFDDAAFALKEKGVSNPVKTQFGWHVIELLGRRAALQKPLEEVKEEIVSILEQEQLEQWYLDIEKESRIKVLNPAYQ